MRAILGQLLVNLHNTTMKKITLLIGFLFLTTLSAQETQEFKYGITGNFHQGSIVGVHDVSKGAFGGSLGVFAQWALVENDIFDSAWLYLMPQIEYNMGGEIARAEEETFGKQIYQHDYVAMQVYLRYFFHQGNMKRDMYVFAGPRIEYLVRQESKVDPAYNLAYYKYNLDDEIKKFGYGVSFGIGLKVSQQFEAFMRYDRGFSKVYPKNNINNTYNRQLAVGLNYYLNENWW